MNNREQRAALAQETVRIINSGKYMLSGKTVNIFEDVAGTNNSSVFISQQDAGKLEAAFSQKPGCPETELRNESTLASILRLSGQEIPLGVMNFASAKNPGGGFLNGSMAQEESLAVSSALYLSQINCSEYYDVNRAFKSMIYTDCAIFSPDVVFFRDDGGNLLPEPIKASVLTLPAVNYGQVLVKGENPEQAKAAMKRRMKIALAIFAEKECKTLVLGAFGCGVFRNDPTDVVGWWDELLKEYGGHFGRVVFAVLDRSKDRECLSAFERKWGAAKNG